MSVALLPPPSLSQPERRRLLPPLSFANGASTATEIMTSGWTMLIPLSFDIWTDSDHVGRSNGSLTD